ncbi:39S ribosomal protein L54, mitochondrial [Habropoda laboriosa]|uniref:Large ribosomal subunit protein mL54 n=1 Tax=Habropoda laboriosa TaxID=597456 RepID=A0A0L7QMJ6_9HYME|nr:PREDICTED: 39S ribosomal protein L54, mitochondrial [Habropoda laboriosa]KOC59779.1 39S ribosomal protein L54, mitochondrial [Habropoda laboriosa]
MSLLSILRLCRIGENVIIPAQYVIQTKNYAVDKKKPAKAVQQKIDIPVEKDVNKLITYVCGSNIYNDGEDVKLKPDSEYPEWIWNIRTEPLKLEDLDPNTKQYWRYVRKQAMKRNNQRIKYRRL